MLCGQYAVFLLTNKFHLVMYIVLCGQNLMADLCYMGLYVSPSTPRVTFQWCVLIKGNGESS